MSWAVTKPTFLVNPSTPNKQFQTAITTLSDGRLVLTYTQTTSAGASVRGQILNSDGSLAGPEFLVSDASAGEVSTYSPKNSSVVGLEGGGFAVTWDVQSTSGDANLAVLGRVFDGSGSPLGAEFRVNTTTSMFQSENALARLPGGGFVATWTDTSATGGDTSTSAIRGQRYDGSGAPVGGEFLVNTKTAGSQISNAVATLTDGRFIVTWTDSSGNLMGHSIRAQLFEANGTPSGSEMVIHDDADGYRHGLSSVTPLAGGGYVVAWNAEVPRADRFTYPTDQHVRAQVFGADGAPLGNDFRVGPQIFGQQPDVTALADGRFVVAWPDGASNSAAQHARIYAADGTPSGKEFIITTPVTSNLYQGDSAVTALPDGRFVVTWSDGTKPPVDPTGANRAVFAQIYDATRYDGDGTNETVIGGSFADTLNGAGGDDVLRGAAGGDILSGGDGADVLDGGAGADQFGGDGGFDFAFYNAATSSVTADLLSPASNTGEAAGDTYSSIEGLIGSEFSDALLGNDEGNAIYGAAGDDTITGRGGDDALFGHSGQDVFYGGLGADLIDGGDGFDFVSYAQASSAVAVDLLVAATNAGAEAAGDSHVSIEGLIGSDFADGLLGDDGANSIYGGAGDDFIWGRGGDDALLGTGGNDTLDGQGGNDTLIGDVGTGLDHDTFVFGPGFGVDRVYGFGYNPGDNHDFILFHASEFSSFAEVMASARQQGTAVVIQKAGDADMLILEGMDLAGLTVDDVGFYL
jgi:Ca2+-binding RTX toxin-like protein